jgi:hypothetical protein
MDRFREVRLAACLFFGAAASLGASLTLQGEAHFDWFTLRELAAKLSPVAFLCACAFLLISPRSGFMGGAVAGLLYLPWFFPDGAGRGSVRFLDPSEL